MADDPVPFRYAYCTDGCSARRSNSFVFLIVPLVTVAPPGSFRKQQFLNDLDS
jgi:hypothetical protein